MRNTTDKEPAPSGKAREKRQNRWTEREKREREEREGEERVCATEKQTMGHGWYIPNTKSAREREEDTEARKRLSILFTVPVFSIVASSAHSLDRVDA